MSNLTEQIINKVRELCQGNDDLNAIVSQPTRVHLEEVVDNEHAHTKIVSIVFDEHGDNGDLTVTDKRMYLTWCGGRVGKTLYEYDGWNELLKCTSQNFSATMFQA
jgi:hypothetical protein